MTLVIVHFSPIELYPPIQNLIRQWGDSRKVMVITTTNATGNLRNFEVENSQVRITRIGRSGGAVNILNRYLTYSFFYIGALVMLIRLRPRKVLYYETISSLPVFLYRKYINRQASVFIHYHEYVSKEEISRGMLLNKIFWKLEQWLLLKARWVSQTNTDRLEKFKEDISPILIQGYLLPNYPPSSWRSQPKEQLKSPLRVVYVGALSLTTMYTREFAEWVLNNKGNVLWDIYSYNFTDDARNYLQSLSTNLINLKPGIEYDDLRTLLVNYDVGIILYKGHIPNYVYNAPNKLFEYLTCGLDVWFPDIMVGCKPYMTFNKYPKVLSLNFNQLPQFDLEKAISRDNCSLNENTFFCEEALNDLLAKLE